MPPRELLHDMDELALQPTFQSINARIMSVSRSANRVICLIRMDFEFTSRVLKRDVFDDHFGFVRGYKKHFWAMPEDPAEVEEIAWQLLHTDYWQIYYRYYGRSLPSRQAFHDHYFERLPGKKAPSKSGIAEKVYAVIPGSVYLIDAVGSGHTKIGRSGTALARLDSLETASPYPLKLLRQINTKDAGALERQLHRRYGAYKVHREWFELPADVLAALLTEEFA